jgi:penicillin-binding protein A
MRRLSPRFRSRSLLRSSDTLADTIIDGPRLRLPPPAAIVALALGLGVAFVVDRALARAPDVADAATSEGARRPHVQALAAEAEVAVQDKPRLGATVKDASGRVTAAVGDAVAVLARDAELEQDLERTLVDGRTPFSATVLIEIGTGRVLAVAEHSTRGDASGFAFMPMAKAASIFKIVTTAALLRADVPAATKVCVHGGKTRMQPSLLVDNPRRDHQCTTMQDALPLSQNVAIAKLALKHLEPDALRAEAERFGFFQPLPTDIALESDASPAVIPEDPFGFANAAAGFGDVKISALHGAVLAATIAQGGVLVPPRFIDALEGKDAPAIDAAAPRRVLDEADAKKIADMLEDTVVRGTARRSFSQGPRLKHSAAGKTGSLADYSTGLDTSWFVGYAPADRPRVAVATVVVNTSKWHVKAPYVAKEALRAYFVHDAAAKSDAKKKAASTVVAAR